MVQLQQVDRNDGVEAICGALDADGGVIVRDFLSPATLKQFRADIEAHVADHRAGSVAATMHCRARAPELARKGNSQGFATD